MIPSQQAQFNWNQGGSGYGASPMYDMGSLLMGNQLGSYLNFPNAMQGAMNQMLGVNLANQNAQLTNNSFNTRLGESSQMANALMQQALANAYGNIGAAYQGRQGLLDQLNNPTMQDYLKNNSGVAVANAQNAGALARLQQLPGILQSLGGLFGGGSGGGGLLGFSGSGGQQAVLPQQTQPTATQMAVKASQPLPQQAAQTAVGSPSVAPALAGMAQRGGGMNPALAMSRNYLDRYLGMS